MNLDIPKPFASTLSRMIGITDERVEVLNEKIHTITAINLARNRHFAFTLQELATHCKTMEELIFVTHIASTWIRDMQLTGLQQVGRPLNNN